MLNLDRVMLLRRAQSVQRFHTCVMNYRQSVGEHTFGVLCILLEVFPEAGPQLIRAVLYHDAAEAEVGDIPSPALGEYSLLRDGNAIAESIVMGRADLHTTITESEKRLLKFCDRMECMIFGLEEWYRGNRFGLTIAERCEGAIRKDNLHRINQKTETLFQMYTVKLVLERSEEGEVDERE